MRTTIAPDGRPTFELNAAERVSSRIVTRPDGEQDIVPSEFGRLALVLATVMFAGVLVLLGERALQLLATLLHNSHTK